MLRSAWPLKPLLRLSASRAVAYIGRSLLSSSWHYTPLGYPNEPNCWLIPTVRLSQRRARAYLRAGRGWVGPNSPRQFPQSSSRSFSLCAGYGLRSGGGLQAMVCAPCFCLPAPFGCSLLSLSILLRGLGGGDSGLFLRAFPASVRMFDALYGAGGEGFA